MLIDAHTLAENANLSTDICIIGSGPAGITIARELVRSGQSVCMLESGRLNLHAPAQELSRARCEGTLMTRDTWNREGTSGLPVDWYMQATRTRIFGGNSTVWSGYCRPFEAIDFEQRSWIPHSGWPLTKAELEPFYERAASVCQITSFANEDRYQGTPERPLFPTAGTRLLTRLFHFSPTNFAEVYRDELTRSENLRVVYNATALELEANDEANHVQQVHVGCLNGRRFRVSARAFVLATGGVENARLLLLSRNVQKNGLGNQDDLVGRYFMDHAHMTPGYILNLSEERYSCLYSSAEADAQLGCRTRGMLALSAQAQREHQLPNHLLHILTYYTPEENDVLGMGRVLAGLSSPPVNNPWWCHCQTFVENEPNPNNRVRLTNEIDPLGCPRAHVTWNLQQSDSDRTRRMFEVVGKELGRAGLGRVRPIITEEDPFPQGWGGSHHMGTTRMSADPRKGVVNAQCRMHHVHNVYLAGSSVFPTAGAANPTFTIVALALRLADHLREVFSG